MDFGAMLVPLTTLKLDSNRLIIQDVATDFYGQGKQISFQ